MPSQSITARQLVSSIVSVQALQPQTSTDQEVASRVAAYRARYVARMAELIHNWTVEERKAAPSRDAIAWRDAWCHDCDINDAFSGTALQHASRIYDLGWKVEGGVKGNLLLCAKCQGGE